MRLSIVFFDRNYRRLFMTGFKLFNSTDIGYNVDISTKNTAQVEVSFYCLKRGVVPLGLTLMLELSLPFND